MQLNVKRTVPFCLFLVTILAISLPALAQDAQVDITQQSKDGEFDRVGTASWYGPNFDGNETAISKPGHNRRVYFDQTQMSAAYPIKSMLDQFAIVRRIVGPDEVDPGPVKVWLNDLGPFHDNRILDLSRGAAEKLDIVSAGVAEVGIRFVAPLQITSYYLMFRPCSFHDEAENLAAEALSELEGGNLKVDVRDIGKDKRLMFQAGIGPFVSADEARKIMRMFSEETQQSMTVGTMSQAIDIRTAYLSIDERQGYFVQVFASSDPAKAAAIKERLDIAFENIPFVVDNGGDLFKVRAVGIKSETEGYIVANHLRSHKIPFNRAILGDGFDPKKDPGLGQPWIHAYR